MSHIITIVTRTADSEFRYHGVPAMATPASTRKKGTLIKKANSVHARLSTIPFCILKNLRIILRAARAHEQFVNIVNTRAVHNPSERHPEHKAVPQTSGGSPLVCGGDQLLRVPHREELFDRRGRVTNPPSLAL